MCDKTVKITATVLTPQLTGIRFYQGWGTGRPTPYYPYTVTHIVSRLLDYFCNVVDGRVQKILDAAAGYYIQSYAWQSRSGNNR